ncbi:hypothetical protein AVEN_235845-1 [Araneus ventricosus]|uniref:Histone-lysine N-methyltransferase SETMAR n=1 Tax=Araneus ventricosus TaxID=182803 RepID=A0A4Y2C521_ARAVE|nr:hypothetical protein AVEN_235845-1 [Araneus ventricosus]
MEHPNTAAIMVSGHESEENGPKPTNFTPGWQRRVEFKLNCPFSHKVFIKSSIHCIQTKDRSHISAVQLTPLFGHPPYSPDLAPSDFHLFLKLKEFLGGKRSGSDEELENAVTTWLNELAAEEYDMGILKIVDRCDKCLNVGDDYVEK